jgi:hypothetical protein
LAVCRLLYKKIEIITEEKEVLVLEGGNKLEGDNKLNVEKDSDKLDVKKRLEGYIGKSNDIGAVLIIVPPG